MGKKRRLNSAKAKFRAKHSNHPRMRLLMKDEKNTTIEEETPVVETTLTPAEEIPEVKVAPKAVVTPTLTKALEPKTPTLKTTTPKVTKAKKTTTTRKKTTTSPRKRTTKKKTTSASV